MDYCHILNCNGVLSRQLPYVRVSSRSVQDVARTGDVVPVPGVSRQTSATAMWPGVFNPLIP